MLGHLRWRSAVAGVSGLVGALAFRVETTTSEAFLWVPAVWLVVAAVVAQIPRLGPQLLARAVWWSNLVLGALLCALGNDHERRSGLGLELFAGLALLLAERRVLGGAAAARPSRPAAFAGTLQLVMILALADAQTLGLLSAAWFTDHERAQAGAFGVAAALLLVGFVGLYRLQLWGVFVTMGTAALLGGALLAGVFDIQENLVAPLVVIAAAQILAPMPMLASMLSRRSLPSLSPRSSSAFASVFVGLLMVGATLAALR